MLNSQNLRHIYLKLPDPKEVIMWRVDAKDELLKAQLIDYAEWRPLNRSGRPGASGPSDTKGALAHVWTDRLTAFVPQEYDYLTLVDDAFAKSYLVESLSSELAGNRWRLNLKRSSIEPGIQSVLQTALDEHRSGGIGFSAWGMG